jgi:pimeloyl-ACP methyl ester carboxylesterase
MVVRRLARAGTIPELVWIHGLGERSSCFDAIVSHRLLGAYSHVLPDLPGYGDSQPPVLPPSGNSLDATAAHLVDWLSTWPARPAPILVGHSMGGVLATLVAERMPVRGVLDVDGNLSRGDCTYSMEAAAQSLEVFTAHGLAAMRATVAAGGATDPSLRGYAEALGSANPAVFHRNATDLVDMSVPETLAGRLSALGVPVLFIAGLPGGICTRSQQLLDQHHIPWVGLQPSGHWPFIDQVDLFAATVRAFVRELAI